jgi:DTW domain-containing protein YfiP
MDGIIPEDRDIYYAKEHLDKKIQSKSSIRCQDCWFDLHGHCICAKLHPISFHPRYHFIIYMDYKEYLNPGDDAKLLRCTSPQQTSLVLYPHEDDKLSSIIQSIHESHGNICILFPNERSIAYEDYQAVQTSHDDDSLNISSSQHIIVIDSVWRRARKMARHLYELYPEIPHIQLSPEQISVYARQQSQADRISTIEALALFLESMGEEKHACQALVNAVKINNSSLKRKPAAIELS